MESIRIKKKWVKKIQYLSANSVGGGGGPAELVKSQLFEFFFLTLPLLTVLTNHFSSPLCKLFHPCELFQH